MTQPPEDPTATNAEFWNAMAGAHGGEGDAYYDLDALVAGQSSLSDAEEEALALAVGDASDLSDLDVLHVQCHLGMDSISMARRGARVTGVDFSSVAVQRARELAQRSGVDVTFVEGDSTALPLSLKGRFDVAYATIGVLCWIEDLYAWMRSVSSTLRPGGRLVLVDLHPLFQMVGSLEPLVLDMPYAFAGPHVFDEDESYSGVSTGAGANVNYAHSLGEIVTAALAAGLRVDAFREHLETSFDPRGTLLSPGEDDRFRLLLGGMPAPVLYTLVASVPAQGPATNGPRALSRQAPAR